MSFQFKNMAASITGQLYYAKSIEFSEGLDITYFDTLGNYGTSSVLAKAPEGTVSMSFYVTTGEEISAITGQYGKTGFVSVRGGPFSAEKALLSSFSVRGEANGIVEGSVGYNYYGSLTSGSDTTIGSATIVPAHGGATVVQASGLGAASVISFDYAVSQSHEVRYGIGSSLPKAVTFQEGTRTLNLQVQTEDLNFAQSSLSGTSGVCPNGEGDAGFSPKVSNIILKNLCEETVCSLDISGYLDSRDFSASPNENVQSTLNITEKFPNSIISGEC